MSCDPYIELISAQLDGELTEPEAQTLTAHLDTCPQCRAIARDFGLVHSAMTHMAVPAPEGLSDEVVRRHRQQKSTRRRTLRQFAALAACLLLTVGVVRMTDAMYSDHQRQQDATPMTVRTLDPDAQAITQGEPDHYAFTHAQATRVTYGSTPAAPSAVVIGSRASLDAWLDQFPHDDLSALKDTCTEDFFRSHRLLAVVADAESGSIRCSLAPQGLTWDSVEVQRVVPEACTDDMAAWLLTAQVDHTFPDGHRLAVEFTQ
ncbi:MAG: zf-HC2 domain-containing protein [Oscillospiraceae bacterium]|nr:zf-HC2 domain-containing protein [Oscillospiraceae bacterium]